MKDETTNELIARLKKKDESAFNEVMEMYKNRIYNYLHLMLGDRDMAEELTQDTFVKVYFKAGSLKTGNLKSWIYTIATNLARSEFRKIKVRKLLSLSDVNEGQIAYEYDHHDSLILEQTLAALPEKYRIAVVMKDINNFSLDEIADILKKPVSTVKTLIFRGRQKMRVTMALQNGGVHG